MESDIDLEKLRMRIWDRFLTIRAVYGETISFDQFWCEFPVRYSASDSSLDSYVVICRELENRIN